MTCIECGKWEARQTRLENLLFDARKEITQRSAAYLMRENVLDDIEDENIRLRKVMLELAHITDPEAKERISRRVLGEEKSP